MHNNISNYGMLSLFDDKHKQKSQCTCNSNFEARSFYHSCGGKTLSVRYGECISSLSYPARKVHEPFYVVICGLFGCTTFFPIIS